MHRTDLVGRVQNVTVLFGTELTADGGDQLTDALVASSHPELPQEASLLIYLGAFSGTPGAPVLTVTVLDSDTPATAASFVASTDAEGSKVYGAVVDGGGGETIPSRVQEFHFSPGFFKKGVRFNITLDTTAGTETVDCTAILRLTDAKRVPMTQASRSTIMVTPS